MPRDFSQPDPSPFRAQRQFTDREEFQEAFWDRINALDPERQSVLYFYGVGGIGKSALLGELRRQLRDLPHMISRPTPHKKASWGWVDFQVLEYRHAPNALLQLRETLAERGKISLPTFDLAYAHYHLRFYHEELPKGLRDLAGRLNAGEVTKDALAAILEEIPVLSTIYKFGNLFSKAADARQENLRLQQNSELRLFLLEQDPLKMTGRLVDFFAADLRASHLPNRPVILFLDTFEALSVSGTTEYAGARPDSWVERLAGALPGVLMVIAGRRALDWAKRDADWEQRDLLETHLVGDLAPEDAHQFLTRAGLPDHIIPAVLESFHGLPFYLDLIIDLYEQGVIKNNSDPVTEVFSGSMAQVIDRFLSYLTPAEQAAVRVLSAPSSFDYDRFRLLMAEFSTAYPQDRDSYERLLRYSLFLREGAASHVHEVARDFLNGETQQSVREYLVRSIEKQLSQASIVEFDVNLQIHLEEGFEQVLWLKGGVKAVDWQGKNDSIFQKAGRIGLLENLLHRALAIRKATLGEDHPNTINSISNLASCLENLGRAKEALPLYEKAFVQYRKVFGEDHPNTITLRNNLAICLSNLGRLGKALPLYEKALMQRQKVLGEDHPDTILSLNNLAFCLQDLGRAKEALPLCEKALVQYRKVFGEDHPNTILSLNNLASCLNTLGRSGEALPLYEKALVQRQKVLGEDHPDTISSFNNLAFSLNNLGRSKEALPFYEKALVQYRKVFGEDHPNTILSLNNLASCLYTLGYAKEALPLYEKVLEQNRKLLGKDHPKTITLRTNLALCLCNLGRSEDALPLLEKALVQYRKVLGEDHPNTILSLNNLAYCLNDLGRSEDAIPLLEKALLQCSKVLGEGHPDTILSLNNLAYCLNDLGRLAEALPLFEKALEQRRTVLGEDHPDTIKSLEKLKSCLQDLGRDE